MDRDRARSFIAIGLASILLTGLMALLVHPFDPDRGCCDHLAYRSMSYNLFEVTRPALNVPPSGNVMFTDPQLLREGVADYVQTHGLNRLPPFVYRVVTPLLARLIASTMSIDHAYYLTSFFALTAAAALIGLAIFELTGSSVPALAGVVLFAADPYTGGSNLHDYMLTDPMAFLFVALAIWALVRRKRLLFFVACGVGILNKESMVPMLVTYPIAEVLVDHRVRWSTIWSVVGISAGYVVFRVAMPEAVAGYTVVTQARNAFGQLHLRLIIDAGIAVFGLMVPAAIRRPWGSRLVISLLPFAAAAVMAGSARHQVQALPVICVGIFWFWPPDPGRRLLTVLVVPLVLLRMHASQVVGVIPHITPALLVVAAAAEVWLWWLGRRPASRPAGDVVAARRVPIAVQPGPD